MYIFQALKDAPWILEKPHRTLNLRHEHIKGQEVETISKGDHRQSKMVSKKRRTASVE